MRWMSALLAVALVSTTFSLRVAAQDQQDDPPSRVARLGHMEGSISFQPAGESEWVQAVSNRPLTTGDKIWADKDSRAELQLGAASIRLNSNTGFSFLNLDDRTVQIQLSAGAINVRVRHLSRDDVFEIDTPNQAFSIFQPGRYRIEASEDGNNTVVSVREGEGESTGNGQTYTLHAGQRATFSGTNSLNADFEDLGPPDDFDNWSNGRDRRYEYSRSSRYVSHDVVGYEDLDDNGDWRPDSSYGNVWYPHVSAGWAPYREGHWAWIDPWGWTWVDDEPWGYAPFHYGRWMAIEGRWGWIPGPVEVVPVYAPALVVFVGGGAVAFGDNVAWFPLGPREVYVPSYQVSREYVNRVNVSNTTVNQTTITNVYNTTIVNNNTTITNVNYVNRNVNGAVTAVPQHTFATAQPVARAAVPVNARQLASAPVGSRAPVPPAREAVLGAHAQTANRVAAPPAAVSNRQVIAKTAPPPPPPTFAARQQQLTVHPGQPLPRQEMQRLAPAHAAGNQPPVRVVAAGRPATPNTSRPGNQPANTPANQPNNQPGNQPANRPGNQPAPSSRPEPNRPEPNRPQPNPSAPNNRPAEPPMRNDRPSAAQPGNRPQPNQPAPNNRPEPNRREPNRPQPTPPAPNNRPAEPPARNDRPPAAQPNNRPEPTRPEPNQPAPDNRPEPNRPQPNPSAPNNRPTEPPMRNDRPPAAQPNSRPEPTRPEPNQPAPNNRPEPNRPQPNQPAPNNRPTEPPARSDRPPAAQPNNHPETNRAPAPPPQRSQPAQPPQNPSPSERPQQRTPPPAEARPPQPQRQPTPEERKRQEEQRKQDARPQPPQ